MLTKISRSLSYLVILTAVACGKDDVTGPGEVEFPTISQSALDGSCIRGTVVLLTSVSGTISTTDCLTDLTPVGAPIPVGTEPGFFEGWRVRVATSTAVTFSVTSQFDTFLDLFRIDDLSSPVLTFNNLLAFNDDGGAGFDALLTYPLQPNTEYWIMISGFSADELGDYSLALSLN